jgi:hypothetical protein
MPFCLSPACVFSIEIRVSRVLCLVCVSIFPIPMPACSALFGDRPRSAVYHSSRCMKVYPPPPPLRSLSHPYQPARPPRPSPILSLAPHLEPLSPISLRNPNQSPSLAFSGCRTPTPPIPFRTVIPRGAFSIPTDHKVSHPLFTPLPPFLPLAGRVYSRLDPTSRSYTTRS